MSGVCRHGALRRVCEICDLEETVKELEAEIERLKNSPPQPVVGTPSIGDSGHTGSGADGGEPNAAG